MNLDGFVKKNLEVLLSQKFRQSLKLIEKKSNSKCFLVGGSIRDLAICFFDSKFQVSKEQKDFDFILDSSEPIDFCQKLSEDLEAKLIILDEKNKIYRILYQEQQFDFTKLAGNSLKEDLRRRDFSINALAFDWQENKIIDFTNSLNDLKAKKIRSIKEKNLKEDPLRILRAYRFRAELDFKIESETHQQIINNQNLIKQQKVSQERISSEFFKILDTRNSFSTLWQMFEDQALFLIIPELKAQTKIPPNDFHHLRLIEHTLELVKQQETKARSKFPVKYLDYIDRSKISYLKLGSLIKLGCLLHDICKPETWEFIRSENKHTFYNHDLLGAQKTFQISKRLCLPKSAIEFVSLLVKFHLRPFSIAKLGQEPSLRAQRRIFLAFREYYFPSLVLLCWADLFSIRGPKVTSETIKLSEERLLNLLKKYELFLEEERQEPLLLKGQELKEAIEKSKIKPSKEIKKLLDELRELQIEKKIKTKKEAFLWFVQEASSLQK